MDITEEVYNIILKMTEAKKSPHHVTKVDLLTEVCLAVSKLRSQGRVEIGDTINDKYIKIV